MIKYEGRDRLFSSGGPKNVRGPFLFVRERNSRQVPAVARENEMTFPLPFPPPPPRPAFVHDVHLARATDKAHVRMHEYVATLIKQAFNKT